MNLSAGVILPGDQYFGIDPDKAGEVAKSMGAALGLEEFKVTTPLADIVAPEPPAKTV